MIGPVEILEGQGGAARDAARVEHLEGRDRGHHLDGGGRPVSFVGVDDAGVAEAVPVEARGGVVHLPADEDEGAGGRLVAGLRERGGQQLRVERGGGGRRDGRPRVAHERAVGDLRRGRDFGRGSRGRGLAGRPPRGPDEAGRQGERAEGVETDHQHGI